ncbi:MAG: nuclear transport factor 2 family protein, partial [Chloroflexota bacterium]|nr:nuclear transport factor 2 family protein [Chloroflexota bacterium]
MSQQLAQEFIDALHALEERGEIEPLLAQFAEDAELTNVNLQEPMRGAEGVRKFWEDYRSLFS